MLALGTPLPQSSDSRAQAGRGNRQDWGCGARELEGCLRPRAGREGAGRIGSLEPQVSAATGLARSAAAGSRRPEQRAGGARPAAAVSNP